MMWLSQLPWFELSGPSINWTFDDLGSYKVTLMVTDPSGNIGMDEVFVNVTPREPVLSITSPSNGTEVRGNTTIIGVTLADLQQLVLICHVFDDGGNLTELDAEIQRGPFSYFLNLSTISPGNITIGLAVDDRYSVSTTHWLNLTLLPPEVIDNGDNGKNDEPSEDPWSFRTSALPWLVLALSILSAIVVAIYFSKRDR